MVVRKNFRSNDLRPGIAVELYRSKRDQRAKKGITKKWSKKIIMHKRTALKCFPINR